MTVDSRLKLLLLCSVDILVIFACQNMTLLLLQQSYVNILIPASSSLAFIVSGWTSGFYRTNLRYMGIGVVKQTVAGVVISGVVIYVVSDSLKLTFFASALTLISLIGYRVFAREVFFQQRHSNAAITLVYGAGSAGVQFVTASMQGDVYNVVGYIDDNPQLCGTSIHGRNVFASKKIEMLVNKHQVRIIVLALPTATTAERKGVIESLIPLPVRVVTVPNFHDLIDGKQRITQTEQVSVEDLLGREPVPPLETFMKKRTTDKVCLITGAGGSIGSELCRQIAKTKPKYLILLDVGEPALFAIEQELLRSGFSKIYCALGSVTDDHFVNRVFSEHKIDCVYHAAAYKHVPMVEANPMAGLVNNVKGTQTILQTAIKNEAESFTLISTDKAVRPTNVMGATKRLAEMVCQGAAESCSNTVISMVRFGNVLGSSGSVIPTFQEQIEHGGPVTLTHPEVTRYFMTIPEAAQLVVQASGMSKTGDLFLLDMGTPIKIYDLAERLIRLSGRSVAAEGNLTNGGIEIKITGLRPGEKLYEELLVDAAAQATAHPKIMRAREHYISVAQLEDGLEKLTLHLNNNRQDKFKEALSQLVVGYDSSGGKSGG